MSKPICVIIIYDLSKISYSSLESLYEVHAFQDLQSTIQFIHRNQERTRIIISGKNYFRDASQSRLERNLVYELLEYLRDTSHFTASCTVVMCSLDLKMAPYTPAVNLRVQDLLLTTTFTHNNMSCKCWA